MCAAALALAAVPAAGIHPASAAAFGASTPVPPATASSDSPKTAFRLVSSRLAAGPTVPDQLAVAVDASLPSLGWQNQPALRTISADATATAIEVIDIHGSSGGGGVIYRQVMASASGFQVVRAIETYTAIAVQGTRSVATTSGYDLLSGYRLGVVSVAFNGSGCAACIGSGTAVAGGAAIACGVTALGGPPGWTTCGILAAGVFFASLFCPQSELACASPPPPSCQASGNIAGQQPDVVGGQVALSCNETADSMNLWITVYDNTGNSAPAGAGGVQNTYNSCSSTMSCSFSWSYSVSCFNNPYTATMGWDISVSGTDYSGTYAIPNNASASCPPPPPGAPTCTPSGSIGPDSSDGYPNSDGGQEIVTCNRVVGDIRTEWTSCYSGPAVGSPSCRTQAQEWPNNGITDCGSVQTCNEHWFTSGPIDCGETHTESFQYWVYDSGTTQTGSYVIGSYTRC